MCRLAGDNWYRGGTWRYKEVLGGGTWRYKNVVEGGTVRHQEMVADSVSPGRG